MPESIPPLLSRSLALIDTLLEAPLPRSFGQIRSLTRMGDASLARLLHHLLAAGVLEKGRTQTYLPGPRLLDWRDRLRRPTEVPYWGPRMVALARESGHSCALVVLEMNKILVYAAHSLPESVSVMEAGELLCFERDHAAALAILSRVEEATARELISGEFSRIPSMAVLRQALKRFSYKGYFLDRSRVRRGVSRLAVPLTVNGHPAALYLCGLSADLARRARQKAALLHRMVESAPTED